MTTPPPTKPWSISRQNDVSVLSFDVPDRPIESEWEQYVFMSSDWHWDNEHCDLALLKRDLNCAVERDAPVCVFGDMFCLMQGRYDPRRSRSGMRPALDKDNYLDEVVRQSSEWCGPYAEHLALVSMGNHEASNLRNNDTNVLERFCERMRMKGSDVVTTGMGGWLFVRARLNGKSITTKIAFHHGAGGGGAVTKGVPAAAKRSAYLPQADLFFSGHIHQRWQMSNTQEVVSNQGRRSLKEQTHVCLPTYKQEYCPDGYDFHNLNERPPKPLGGCWVRFYVGHDMNQKTVLKHEIVFS